MKAKDLMSTTVLSLTPETTVGEALEILVTKGVSGAPVIDASGKIFGVLTEEDLMLYYEYPDECRFETPIKDARVQGAALVTRGLISVSPETPAEEIATLFIGRKIKRVPVVAEGKILGIVSRRDLLKGLLASHSAASPRKS